MAEPNMFVLIGHGAGDVIEIHLSADHRQIRLRCNACGAEQTRAITAVPNELQRIAINHRDDCVFWCGIQTSYDRRRASGRN